MVTSPTDLGALANPHGAQLRPSWTALAELVDRQHGIVDLGQLDERGFSKRRVQLLVQRRVLRRVHRGVYSLAHGRLSREALWLAAVRAAGPGALLSHRSAAALWGIRPDARRRVDVIAPRTRHALAGVDVHRPRIIDPRDITELDGIPVTTWAATIVDLGAVLDRAGLERAVHESDVRRLLDVDAVMEVLDRRPQAKARRLVARAIAESQPVLRSEFEVRFRDFLRDAGLEDGASFNRHMDVGERLVEIDVAYMRERVAIELHGWRPHRTRRAFEGDAHKARSLAVIDWRTVPVTWRQFVSDRRRLARELRQILGRN